MNDAVNRKTTAPNLLPCPFCGGAAEVEQGSRRAEEGGQEWDGTTYVRCTVCRVSKLTDAYGGDSIDGWNTRPAHSPVNTALPAGSVVSHDRAQEAAQRLVNSHFNNPMQARTSIPVSDEDDDMVIMAYIKQQRALTQPVNTGPSAPVGIWKFIATGTGKANIQTPDGGMWQGFSAKDAGFLCRELNKMERQRQTLALPTPSAPSGGAEEAAREVAGRAVFVAHDKADHPVNLVDVQKAAAIIQRAIDGSPTQRKFALGDRVTKTKGSSWTGRVVGFYSTDLTPVGYAVESETETGSVQIYPEAALAAFQSPEPGSNQFYPCPCGCGSSIKDPSNPTGCVSAPSGGAESKINEKIDA